jgi:hypothetical protein
MPLIDLTYPAGALTEKAKQDLRKNMWRICLRWEAIPRNEATASICWAYFDERPRNQISAGGEPLEQNIYRIQVQVMVGFMDQDRIDGMLSELTQAVIDADGTKGNGKPRVFCILQEVPSGAWAIDGKVWTSVYTAGVCELDEDRIKRMDA